MSGGADLFALEHLLVGRGAELCEGGRGGGGQAAHAVDA